MLNFSTMQYFNIQVASQLSGVASATIRAWEKRYNAVIPERADNKHRLYSEKDIEKLALLFRLTEIGQSIGKIAHLELNELKTVYSSLLHRPYEELQVMPLQHEKFDHEKMLSSFQIALPTYKLDIISHELEKARTVLSPKDFCLKILVPLFKEVGRSIAQEHTLSATVSFHVGQIIEQHYQKRIAKEELVLISTPEGELHEMGILGGALLCVHHGIKFIYLGTNMPASSLAEAANTLKCKAILLGTTECYEAATGQALEEYLQELTSLLKTNTALWIGGKLSNSKKNLLEKRKIPYFSSLEAFSNFLESF